MKQFLRGNYTLDVVIEEPAEAAADATDAFERKALSRLGGSICFVSKKGFLWKGEAAGAGGRVPDPDQEGVRERASGPRGLALPSFGDGADGSRTADRQPA